MAEETELPFATTSGGYCETTGVYRSLHHLTHLQRIPTVLSIHTASFILSHMPTHQSNPAIIDSASDTRVSYLELRHSALSLAAGLHHALGVCKGDIVLLLSPNTVLYPVMCLAVLAIGAILSPANPLNTAEELSKQIASSGSRLVISVPEEEHKFWSSGIPILLTKNDAEHRTELTVEELIRCCDPAEAPEAGVTQSHTAALLYSSGTTGTSKGVVLTHANLISTISLLRWTVQVKGSGSSGVHLDIIPMFHVYGLMFFGLGLFSLGATVVLLPKFDFHTMLKAVDRYKVTDIPAVPPVVLALSKVSQTTKAQYDLSSLRRVTSGAAPLSDEVMEGFRERFPDVEITQGYGLTESCGATSFTVKEEEVRYRPGSVGQLLPEFCAKVVDVESKLPLPPSRRGELWLKSPTVMKGYLDNEDATKETVVQKGWLRTGDLCYMDDDGFLYIVDRLKELIKYNGFQVAPAELEAIIQAHPEVLDAAVVPVADKETGQIPMAYVVRAIDSHLTEEQMMSFVAAKVAPYKKVRKVKFINSIPRSAAGKILRKQLLMPVSML
ncbi:4-coumarate--CoA ligase 1 [Amborella trichopoda]|nr:4-coumarate--CoA ligase 1 [Amborella trichopoda]|eukprot:XP_006851309.2 4-coumarate--CoA ligase 1 [Amborella trichopoda]